MSPSAPARGLRVVFALLLGVALGCAPEPAAPKASPDPVPEAPARNAVRKALADYVPTPGLRFLVGLRPETLMANAELREDWLPLLSTERLAAYAQASGIDPAQISEAWIAGYDVGLLFVFDGARVGPEVEEAFRKRALTSRDVDTGLADTRFVTGLVDQKPHALLHIEGHLIAIAEGDTGLCRIVLGYAQDKLKASPPALASSRLATHRTFEQDAPFRAFFVGPYEGATDVVVQGAADGVAGVTHEAGQLRVTARARGAWPPLPDLGQRIQKWVLDMANTPEMRALGWADYEGTPEVTCQTPEGSDALTICDARGTWNSRLVARSLYRLVAAPVDELLEGSGEGGVDADAPSE